jgi:hypothetical protein
MSKRDGQQKGPQEQAEGQHGERTHARFLEEIHQPMDRDADVASVPNVVKSDEGRHRLEEDRQQHDEADKNSERNRQRR